MELDVTGSQYQRSYRIVIDNLLGEIPLISFQEEKVTTLATGEIINKHCGFLNLEYDPNFIIPLKNPITNEPILEEDGVTQKTVTLEEAYVIVYSAYWEAAKNRDESV